MVALKICITKLLFHVISKVFKMIFNHVESLHRKSLFYTCFRKFWVIENSFPIVTKLGEISTKKKAKSISTFDFTTWYLTIHEILSEVTNFSFKTKTRSRIGFSYTSVYWITEACGRRYFTRQTLIDVISFLNTKCHFTIGKLVFKQEIGIPMGNDSASYWVNFFPYFFESKYVQQLICKGSPRAYKLHWASRFIDDLSTINNDGEFSS